MRKPTRNPNCSTLLAISTLCLLFSSCADSSYDLDSIDKTMTIGGKEFSIPASNTKEIALYELLNIEEGTIVQPNVQGDYILSQNGSSINSIIKVDTVSISNSEIQTATNAFNLPPLPQLTFNYTVDLPPSKMAFVSSKNNMPIELRTLIKLKVDADIYVTIKINGLTGNALYSNTKDVVVKFPPYLKSSQLVNGVFKVPNGTDLIEGYTVKIKISELNGFGTKYDDVTKLYYQTRGFIATGEIAVDGEIQVLGNGFQVTENNPELQITATMSPMKIKEATGIIDPNIVFEEQEIAISNLPDFLDDNDVVFDPNNPQINLIINNTSPLNTTYYGKVIAMKNGEKTAETNLTCKLTANKNNRICFSRLGQGGAAGFVNIMVPGLSNLLRTIPDKIVLRSSIKSSNTISTFKLGDSYPITTSYSLDVPLTFGAKMNIIYKDTCSSWNKILKDIEVSSAKLYMTAANKTPMVLNLTATAIDVDGNELSDVSVNVDNDTAIDALAKTMLSISIDGSPEVMKQVDGLLLRVNATSPKDSGLRNYVLNKNQTLQFLNMKLKVSGGITADLN